MDVQTATHRLKALKPDETISFDATSVDMLPASTQGPFEAAETIAEYVMSRAAYNWVHEHNERTQAQRLMRVVTEAVQSLPEYFDLEHRVTRAFDRACHRQAAGSTMTVRHSLIVKMRCTF